MSFNSKDESLAKNLCGSPHLVILVGLPGCGKTFFATWLTQRDPNWKIANLREDKDAEKNVHEWVQKGFNVLIDDIHVHSFERAKWIRLAKVYNVKCSVFLFEETFQKLVSRVKDKSDRVRVLHQSASNFEPLHWSEGYDKIISPVTLPDKADSGNFDSEMDNLIRTLKA